MTSDPDYYKRHLGKGREIWKAYWHKREGLVMPQRRMVCDYSPRNYKGWYRDYDTCSGVCDRYAKTIGLDTQAERQMKIEAAMRAS